MARVVALVTARNEEDRIGATVRSLSDIEAVEEVVVVDDGSSDRTASAALGAGATVLSIPRRVGKGAAMEGALRRLPPADVWLFADGDLEETAVGLEPLVAHIVEGSADLAVAILPPQGGGLGLVKQAARRAIRRLSGFDAREPLSGQRAASAKALVACRPFARGFGVETAMTIDAVRAGCRVEEISCEVLHRTTGRGARGFAHRSRQGLDILLALLPRALGLR